MTNPGSKEIEPVLKPCPFCGSHAHVRTSRIPEGSRLVVYWIECVICEIGTKYHDNQEEAVQTWNTRASNDSAGAMVGRTLYSELIHIAAELARGEGFLSTCAEDMNPRLRRTDILKTAEGQERRLKDWAYRVRLVANKLMTAAASPAPKEAEAQYVIIDGERRQVVPCPDGRPNCEVLHTTPAPLVSDCDPDG